MPGVLPLFPGLTAALPRPALRVGETTLDYAAVAAWCARFRDSLTDAGLGPGDRLAIWAHPGLETLLGLVACTQAGVVMIPLNPQLGEKELGHILGHARPRAIFSAQPAADAPRTPLHTVAGLTPTEHARTTPPANPEMDADAPLLIIYTSGTTGAPKGAVLSARNVAASLDGLASAFGLTERDTLVHALPLFHVHGLVVGLFGALRAGACLHFIPKFQPLEIAAALIEARGRNAADQGVLYAVPTMYHRLADAARHDPAVREGLRSARLLVSGSAPLAAREHAQIAELTGHTVRERYGLTETLIDTAVAWDGPAIPGSVGQALPGIELRLVDDARTTLASADGAIGEVTVRGDNVFLGYLDDPAATARVKDDHGWFYTGDLGTLDVDGNLRIVGRKATDLIKTGGFKVGAGEIEGALLEHPSVAECAVLGRPDPDLGERIVAFVVLRTDQPPPATSELTDHVANLLAKHKRPREVHFVPGLPRNAMGKVQKKLL